VEPTEKLPMTTMACHKIHIFAEDEMTFKAPIFDPEQFNKYGQAAGIVELHIRMIIVTNDLADMMPSHHNLVKSATESEDPPLNVSRSKEDQGRQLEALTEGRDSDARQDKGVHNDRHQQFTSPIDTAHKNIVKIKE
jgi:HSP90 family molecular chaperone